MAANSRPPSDPQAPRTPLVWIPPHVSVFKLNVDASLASNSGVVGLGFVIRDNVGHVRVAGSLKMNTFLSPLLDEAMALLQEVRAVLRLGFCPILVESDAIGVVNVLKDGSSLASDLGIIISDIRSVCRSLNVLYFSFVPRTVNKVADALAKAALSSVSDCVWTEVCPPLVELLV
ncbi:hypothetical protein ACOSQ2_023578 [Xanthoceras sorbifolium]